MKKIAKLYFSQITVAEDSGSYSRKFKTLLISRIHWLWLADCFIRLLIGFYVKLHVLLAGHLWRQRDDSADAGVGHGGARLEPEGHGARDGGCAKRLRRARVGAGGQAGGGEAPVPAPRHPGDAPAAHAAAVLDPAGVPRTLPRAGLRRAAGHHSDGERMGAGPRRAVLAGGP